MRTDESAVPALVADIGGTNARFAIAEPAARRLYGERVLSTCAAESVAGLVTAYLQGWPGRTPDRACIAVAGPVVGDACALTNAGLRFSIETTRRQLGLRRLLVVNDFYASARAVPEFGAAELAAIGDHLPGTDGVRLAIGPGTGLGMATVVPAGTGVQVLPGEGGHAALAALYDDELDIIRALRCECGFVSAESVLSGPGLVRLYRALAAGEPRLGTPKDVVREAVDGSDATAVRALTMFCRFLAVVAANAALTVGAGGGVFVAGGILPSCVEFVRSSGFRERFECHPLLGGYLRRIPTAIVMAPDPGLRGALHLLRDEEAPR